MSAKYAILWDMDGVLADSTRLHYLSWVDTFEKRGIEITYPNLHPHFWPEQPRGPHGYPRPASRRGRIGRDRR